MGASLGIFKGFPGGSLEENPPAKQEMQVRSLGQDNPLEKETVTHSFLIGISHGQRNLMGCSPWGCKESDTTLQLNNNNNNLEYSPRIFFSLLSFVWSVMLDFPTAMKSVAVCSLSSPRVIQ